MFDHLGFYTAGDLRAQGDFYKAILEPLGYQRVQTHIESDGSGRTVFGSGFRPAAQCAQVRAVIGGPMKSLEVFTPAGVPTATYIERESRQLETQLKNAIRTPGMITSLSGPSKSGKTVLIHKMISAENLITVSGGAIKNADHLWERVLNWMEAPSEYTSSTAHEAGGTVGGEISGSANALFLKGEAKATGEAAYSQTHSKDKVFARTGIDQVVKEIAMSDFVVFIDDFHYMAPDVQSVVAKQIKEAAEKGVTICTASVPHRSDDVVRRNPELRGRVQAVDFEYWSESEVAEIGVRGFAALGLTVDPAQIKQLAAEVFGSPQLMQQVCLQVCFYTDHDETSDSAKEITLSDADWKIIFERASTTADFSSLLDGLHAGPKQRGTTRNQFQFSDGTSGDVYRCILLALRDDPSKLSFTYDDIYQRTRAVCIGEAPAGSSVASALEQIDSICMELEPNSVVLEWSEDVLDVVDPYFLYYLRCSPRLMALGAAAS